MCSAAQAARKSPDARIHSHQNLVRGCYTVAVAYSVVSLALFARATETARHVCGGLHAISSLVNTIVGLAACVHAGTQQFSRSGRSLGRPIAHLYPTRAISHSSAAARPAGEKFRLAPVPAEVALPAGRPATGWDVDGPERVPNASSYDHEVCLVSACPPAVNLTFRSAVAQGLTPHTLLRSHVAGLFKHQ